MSRSSRMEPVRRVADREADGAARDYARRRDALETERSRLVQLESYREDYRRGFGACGQSGVDAHRLRDYAAFLARIDQALEQQRRSVAALETEVEGMRSRWLQRWGRARALDHLVAEYRREESRAAQRREQAAADELALRRPRGTGPND